MIADIKKDTDNRMKKALDSLEVAFRKIRTGRANPNLLEDIKVSYYGSDTKLSQVANIGVEDSRTLLIKVWERTLVPDVEKAILKSDLGLMPSTAGEVIRVPLPPLTEETRKNFVRQAKAESETAKISIRNVRRDAISEFKSLEKDKEISEDDSRKASDDVQKLTDRYVSKVDNLLSIKETDLMSV